MRTLTKYVIKQSLKPFLMGLGGFIVFVSVEWLYQISDYIIRNRVGFDKLLIFVMYNIPYFTFLGIPVGVLFAIFWVISDMYSSREITALLVHGISAKRLVTPFVILSVILGFFSWLLGDYVVPMANYKSTQILNQYIFQTPESVIKTNMLVELEKDVYFYVKEHNKQKGELYDVVLFRNEEGNEQILTAKKVIKKKDGWFLVDGSMYVVEIETGFLRLDMQFKEMKLDVAGEIEEMLRAYKTTRDKTSKELREQLETYKKLGINTANLLVELNQRYANALGALVIVLIGLPVSLLFGFTSRSWSVILTFLIVVLYQGSGAWLSGMGKEGLMDPILATWLPNIIFASVGFIMYILIDTPIAYKVREFLSRLFVIILISLAFIYGTSSIGFSNAVQAKSTEAYFSMDSVVLKGEVSLIWDKYKIVCDEASVKIVDGVVKVLEASGNVKFYDQDKLYISKKIRYEFETEKAVIVNAKAVYNYDYKGKKVPIYVYGSEIEYDSETSSGIIHSSYLTTCSFEEPHYMIFSSQVYVMENKYIIAENSFLVILGIPIFPYPLYITTLEGVPPYAFSVVFGNTISVVQTFNFAVNDWSVKLDIGTTGKSVEAIDSKQKTNKMIYDETKDYIEFSLSPFTYKYSKGTIYYKLDGQVYIEGNYFNNNNFFHKIGVNVQNQNVYVKPYILYDGRLTDTIVYLNGVLRNIAFEICDDNTFKINSIENVIKLQTDGYLTFLDKTWDNYYQTSYNLGLSSKKLSYSLSINGNVYTSSENRNINYTYQIPWNWKEGPFSIDFNYTFLIKDIMNYASNSKKESLSASDNYTLTGVYNLGPFKISSRWEQIYNFIDEPSSNNKNNLRVLAEVNSPNLTLSIARTFDLINNRLLPDTLTLRYKQLFGDVEFTNSISLNYDNVASKLGNENITFGVNYKPLNAEYTLQFTIQPGKPLENYIHTIKYGNLSVTAYQQNDFIRNAVATGSLDLFGYKTTIRGNYIQPTKTSEPNWNLSYTMEKKDEKYVLSYNLDGKKTYKFETTLKTFDPEFKLGLVFNPEKTTVDYLSLNLDKSLHCWRLNFGIDFTNRSSNILDNIDKIYFKFYLTDMPDRFFQIDPKNGQFEFSGM